MEQFARALRSLRFGWWAIRSLTVMFWYRLAYPGIKVGRGVKLGRNVYFSVVSGGTLEIGDSVHIDANTYIAVVGRLSIGAGSYIGVGSTIVARESVIIGADALVAAYVTIRDQDHRTDRSDAPYRQQGLVSRPIAIGRNVWIGTKATILRGCSIGDNCVIGANAVVTRDIAANAVAVGIPARVIRSLDGASASARGDVV